MTAAVRQPSTSLDRLFAKPRHLLRYPDEAVVRFLAPLNPDDGPALDAGCGSGRHTLLLRRHGWQVAACDSSTTAAGLTTALVPSAVVTVCDLAELPYPDKAFNVVLASASLYYGDRDGTLAKVDEVRRVLKPGGRAFISLRSHRDSRAHHCRRGVIQRPADERGMRCDFVNAETVRSMAVQFSVSDVRLAETFRYTDNWRDSDWHLTLAR